MKETAVAAIASALYLALAHALAIVCVDVNAAGALLSPGGVVDPLVLSSAAAFALLRVVSAGSVCLTLALGAAQLASWLVSKVRP